MIRSDRPAQGGGVAILLKRSLTYIIRPHIPDHESVFLRVNCRGHNFTVCAAYRPPNSSPSYLQMLHDHFCMYKDDQLIISGDFNLPQIDWCQKQSVFNADVKPLLDVMLICDLVQTVTDYTRVVGNARSILDLVFVNSSRFY